MGNYGRRELVLVFIGLFPSVILLYLQWSSGSSENKFSGNTLETESVSYPGPNAQNIFWFLQVCLRVFSYKTASKLL